MEHLEEYIKEETYPVLEGRELYLPKRAIKTSNSAAFNRLKLSLREFEKSFNDQRCENFDMIATYRPYHFNGNDFGLYLYVEMFTMLLLSILQHTVLTFREAHTLALDAVLTHGSFHYLLERYGTLAGGNSFQNQLIYLKYKKEVYLKHWGTAECYEETLANMLIYLSYPSWDQTQKGYIDFLVQRQREGYCQAQDVGQSNLRDLFSRLEDQVLWNCSQDSLRVKRLQVPCLWDYIYTSIPFRFLGLPIYLVNDCAVPEDFNAIINMIFPQL